MEAPSNDLSLSLTELTDAEITMDRPGSSRANIPPWEMQNMAQVPYMGSTSASLSPVERAALPALWAARSNTATHLRADSAATTSSRGLSRTTSAASTAQTEDRVRTPMTAPLFAANKPVYIPAGPRTEPTLPSFVKPRNPQPTGHTASVYPPAAFGRAPLTPPASDTASWSTPSTVGSSKPTYSPQHTLYTLPQTTYTPPQPNGAAIKRNKDADASTHPQSGCGCCCNCQHRKRPSRITRWKLAVKDFFHHEAEDESDFEHIETSHWTDQ